MLEVEAKFRLPDPDALRQRLGELGAVGHAEHAESDVYLNAPDRDFAKTDESLRLRYKYKTGILTYKGPRLKQAVKTRVECEVEIPCGPGHSTNPLELLSHLGYRIVAEVNKRRRGYDLQRGPFTIHICEDHVEKVGRFAEIEIMIKSEDQVPAATAVLNELAADLGLTQAEPRSYLEQLLGHAVTPGGDKTC